MREMRKSSWAFFVLCALILTSCLDNNHGLDTALQMQKDLATIDEYIALNNIDAYQDKSGIRFSITELGKSGFPPRVDQQVKVKYTGKFLNGTVFDPGPEATGVLGTFIVGWQYGIAVLPPGTKATLYLPSPLGYGSSQYNSIPANSILTFDVQLTEVVTSNAEKARLASDIDVIDSFLESHSVDAVKDTTGVRYVITDPGVGPMPTLYQKVKFSYVGQAFSGGTEFFNGGSQPSEIFDSRPIDFIDGITVGLTKIAVGGKIKIYVPSGLAFGPTENTQTSLPANSIVIYDITLEEIVF